MTILDHLKNAATEAARTGQIVAVSPIHLRALVKTVEYVIEARDRDPRSDLVARAELHLSILEQET